MPLATHGILERSNTFDDFQNVRWEALLAGRPSGGPSLNFVQTEADFLGNRDRAQFDIHRSWDVDSFMARATSLGAHRGGFSLSFTPPFKRRITQNQRIRFYGKNIHKLKQLRLGHGLKAGGYSYECHVFFPYLPVPDFGETHLTLKEQAYWYDECVLPALFQVCDADLKHHLPRTWSEVESKSRVNQEIHLSGREEPVDLRYTLPEGILHTFWSRLLESFTDTDVTDQDDNESIISTNQRFRDPFLVVSGHNLKYHTKAKDPVAARANFQQHIGECFNFDYIVREECWMDFGMEDFPVGNDEPITLLQKSCCLETWMKQFACPKHHSRLTKPQLFPWHLTREAASASVELKVTNDWRRTGGIAYNKSYNVHKDLFATVFKNYDPFSNPRFEGLAFDSELLDEYYNANNPSGQLQQTGRRSRLRKAYIDTKDRVRKALLATDTCSFGTRQEYRITLQLFESLDLESLGISMFEVLSIISGF